MELYLQFGWGMMAHSRELVRHWGGGTVILSPRDLEPKQLPTIANAVCKLGGKVLIDPQFYLPRSDYQRLVSHSFWPQEYESGTFWVGTALTRFLDSLRTLNSSLKCSQFILPGTYAQEIDDDWLNQQRSVLDGAAARGVSRDDAIATVALGTEALRDADQLHSLLDASAAWPVSTIYLICEHPEGAYLVPNAKWVFHVLDLIAGFRLQGKRVIVGYCNQQMLIAACARANAIASGTWMNVRSFPPDKFRTQYEEEIRRKAVWYYCPQALSEYKLPTLDTAANVGLLDRMAPPPNLQNSYSDKLFRGLQPTASGFGEQDMFRHYLIALRGQASAASQSTFQETVSAHDSLLDGAETLVRDLRARRIRGEGREFQEAVAANREALTLLEDSRGAVLGRRWGTL